MKTKYALVGALFLALIATVALPTSASARVRVHVYFGTQPYYSYYQPVPGYYYTAPAPSYYYYQPVPRYNYYRTAPAYYYRHSQWRHYDRGRHRGWYRR